jgi:hypothetical protein
MTAQVTERKPEKLRGSGKKICLAVQHNASAIEGFLLHCGIGGPDESRPEAGIASSN